MKPILHWSQTNARLLNACPRAWVNTYAANLMTGSRGPGAPRSGTQRRPQMDDAVVSALRSTWTDRMEDLFVGTEWSSPFREHRLKRRFTDAMDASGLKAPETNLTLHLKRGVNQLEALERTVGLRPLMRGSGSRWAYFERLDGVHVDGVTLYTAPDLAFYHQHKWTLIRLQFRSSAHQTLAQQLEHLLMVKWAMAQPGFPNEANAYRVKVIRWHRHRWIEHHLDVSETLLEQADALVRHDVQEMKWLLRCWNSDADLTAVPYARDVKTCESCAYRKRCPAGQNLAQAKAKQERFVLNLHQREETKSLRTS
jgi:hypothetical protein